MKILIPLLILTVGVWSVGSSRAANPVLDASVLVSEALSHDNLEAARKSASALAKTAQAANQQAIATHAAEIATSKTLEEARVHFKAVSEDTVKLAAGVDGYYVMTCPMAKADWVQKTREVQNPYMGQSMPGCGSLKGDKTSMGMSKKGGTCG